MTAVPFHKILAAPLLCMSCLAGQSQSVTCPLNIDFELGSFLNWECKTGTVTSQPGINLPGWYWNQEIPNRHTIIPATTTDYDKFGGFPLRCPNGSGYSIRLGNDFSGAEAEMVSFTYDIPSTVTNFSIIYHYAIVLQDPGHLPEQQPRFTAKVYDVANNTEINCVSFDFTASASLPGFLPSPALPQVVFKGWTPITVDLSAFAGQKIRLEFATMDCTLGGHFGYAYVDVSSVCNGTISGSFQCEGDNYVSMTAPYGFLSYAWYSGFNFSQVIGNSQSLRIEPAPPLGSIYPVIVSPYPTFGCPDTLYATIASAPKPVAVGGGDRNICSKQPLQLGASPLPGLTYAWTPADLVTNPTVANPFIKTYLQSPTSFILKTTDLYTTCFSYDTVLITPFVVDTASSIMGKMAYCPGETLNNQLTVSNTSTSVQWYSNSSPIPGATNHDFQPTGPSTYWGLLRQSGCLDSTRMYPILLSAVPNANFTVNRPVQCLSTPVSFVNTTTFRTSEPLTYTWRFSDGTVSSDKDPVIIFSNTGNFSATLVAASPAGCKDSLQKDLLVMKDCGVLMPTAFTPNNDGLNDVIKPNLSGVKGLKRFTVYNRNGQVVFSTTREDHGWNGMYNGITLQSGVFVWIVEYTRDDDSVQVQKGTLTLIR